MFDWDSQKDFLNVESVIERCTSDMLFQPDYEQNLAIVDRLVEKPKLFVLIFDILWNELLILHIFANANIFLIRMETYLGAIRRRMANPPEDIVLHLCVTVRSWYNPEEALPSVVFSSISSFI